MGVSINEGGNIDLQTIVAGGPAFAARLDQFRDAAKAAEEMKASAKALKAEAEQMMAEAQKLHAANKNAAAQLAKANAEAEQLQAQLKAKLDKIDRIIRS